MDSSMREPLILGHRGPLMYLGSFAGNPYALWTSSLLSPVVNLNWLVGEVMSSQSPHIGSRVTFMACKVCCSDGPEFWFFQAVSLAQLQSDEPRHPAFAVDLACRSFASHLMHVQKSAQPKEGNQANQWQALVS